MLYIIIYSIYIHIILKIVICIAICMLRRSLPWLGVVPRTDYFILFCSILISNYLSYADSSVGTAGYITQSNKQEGQITFHTHSNSKVVGTAENCC